MIRRITFILPSFAGGGAERVMIMLANGLDRTRFMPSIIVLQAHGPLREIVDDDIPVINLNRQRLRHALKPLITVIRESSLMRLYQQWVMSTLYSCNLENDRP